MEDEKKRGRTMPKLLLIIAVVIIFIILFLQFTRYKMVGKAIKEGDPSSVALLLAPELSTSIAHMLM